MDPIVTTALVGTARQEHVNIATGTPVDALIDGLSASENERKLLLSAGTWAVYRQAGQQPHQIATAPEPAALETLRVCTPQAALLLSHLLNDEHADVLSEALHRLREVGMRLPHHLLPLALTKINKGQRAALFPVLGQRGHWLSQFNSSWDWVRDYLSTDENSLSADAETLWQEGTTALRVEILRRLRAVDPAKARTWLEGVWKQEKSDVRCTLLHTLETSLDAADESFLEKALDDRAPSVRLVVASLLAQIPTSAFIERMCTRGSTMLKQVNGTVGLALPAAFDKDWQRDGILEKPSSRLGQRAWWLIQILAAIPPTFWETNLGAGPTELLAHLPDNEWKVNVIDGWSQAAVRYNASGWLIPLWNWWQEYFERPNQEHITDLNVRENIFRSLPQNEAENIVLTLLNDTQNVHTPLWSMFLAELPKPWSDRFGQAYLHFSCEYYQKHTTQITRSDRHLDVWLHSLPNVALALPIACFAEAQQGWRQLEEGLPWYVSRINETVRAFVETIHTRQKIYEEII